MVFDIGIHFAYYSRSNQRRESQNVHQSIYQEFEEQTKTKKIIQPDRCDLAIRRPDHHLCVNGFGCVRQFLRRIQDTN